MESIWALWPQFSHPLNSLCSSHTRLLSISRQAMSSSLQNAIPSAENSSPSVCLANSSSLCHHLRQAFSDPGTSRNPDDTPSELPELFLCTAHHSVNSLRTIQLSQQTDCHHPCWQEAACLVQPESPGPDTTGLRLWSRSSDCQLN